jgi:hypothetical protein
MPTRHRLLTFINHHALEQYKYEEQRLLYVACSRAKDRLYIFSHPHLQPLYIKNTLSVPAPLPLYKLAPVVFQPRVEPLAPLPLTQYEVAWLNVLSLIDYHTLAAWQTYTPAQHNAYIINCLHHASIPPHRYQGALQRIQAGLQRIIADERWILDHPNQLLPGCPFHKAIRRDATLWLIHYRFNEHEALTCAQNLFYHQLTTIEPLVGIGFYWPWQGIWQPYPL